MSFELRILIGSVIVGLFQLMLATQLATKVRGQKWNFSPRDEKMPALPPVPARLERAAQNFRQTFPFFLAGVCVCEFTQTHTAWTAFGAGLYLACRVIYIPLYGAGIPVVRSVVWLGSMLGVLFVLLSPLFN